MLWVYILQCSEDVIYVGQTSRLYRRFWEHERGEGGVNTSIYKPIKILAVYKLDIIGKFLDYNMYICNLVNDYNFYYYFNKLKNFNNMSECNFFDKLRIENSITECLMIHKKNWEKVRGGRYVRFDKKYKKPINRYLENLPLCNCGLPCDIKYNINKRFLYFRCAKKNIWESFRETFSIKEPPCNFFLEYTNDKPFRDNLNKKREEYKKEICKLFKQSRGWIENIPNFKTDMCNKCVGGCQRDIYKNIRYSYEDKRLCWNCFKNHNEALHQEFSIFSNYLIDDLYE